MNSIKLVVFDVAGTIVEDHGEVMEAFRSALEIHGIAFAESELEEWKGATKRDVIRHFVERHAEDKAAHKAKTESAYSDFRRLLEEHYREHGARTITRATTTFDWLRQRGIKIATTTGFYREVNDLVLEQAGLRNIFAANVSSSDVPLGRPAPFMIFRAMEASGVTSVHEVVNVGDTPLDLQAGTNAGVRGVVGVLTGLHGKERLQGEPHTHILPSVADIPELLEREFVLT
jgi:phosphonatase-like hydrolase